MKIDIITLFPDFFTSPILRGLIKRACDKKIIELYIHNLFNFGKGNYRQVDDRPYGGGAGMVLMVEPIFKALKEIKANKGKKNEKIVLLSASGKLFDQKKAEEYSKLKRLILVCGHFEGVDERVAQFLVDEEISVGNFILSGGEIPALVVLDATIRLLKGVVGKEISLKEESFSIKKDGEKISLVEYPQYTRPKNFQGMRVPSILLSGKHQEIKKWRIHKSILKTQKNRSDLLEKKYKNKENCYSSYKAKRQKLVELARKLQGNLYKYGVKEKEIPRFFDCSSFIQYLYQKIGIELPRSSILQAEYEIGQEIKDLNQLKEGDLIFTQGETRRHKSLKFPQGVGHVAMYIGNGEIIHARGETEKGKNDGKVVEESLRDFLKREKVILVKRILIDF